MKNLFKSLVVFVAVLCSTNHQAQTKSTPLANSLLWEVSGNGLTQPSYIYATVHMICANDYFLSEKVNAAFQASSKLVLEVNMTDPNELASMQNLLTAKEPLDKILSTAQLSKLDKILQQVAGIKVEQVNSHSLSTVMSLLYVKSFDCTDLKYYELEFVAEAKKRNMEVVGLESIQAQLSTIEKAYTNDEMLTLLETLSVAQTAALVNAYKDENISLLYADVTNEKLMNKKTKAEMLDKRNTDWVTKIPALMKKESIFMAVGAAHLAGEYGVLHLLKKAGYTTTPILK